jgi:hypothetical protein
MAETADVRICLDWSGVAGNLRALAYRLDTLAASVRPNPDDERQVETVARALDDSGVDIHASWRCGYPDQFGPCTCRTDTARAVLAALAEAGARP